MPGPMPKLSGRQRGHQGAARPVVMTMETRARLAPEPPAGMLALLAVEWRELWASPVAATFVASDVPALARLFRLRDERERAWRVARRARLVEGSKGQPRLNPLVDHVATLDGEIRQLEDRFGLSPLARLTLGIRLGEAHRSLAQLNAEFLEDDDDD